MPPALRKFWSTLPAPTAALIAHLGSLVAGFLAAFALYYVFYRIGLPGKPFIYVAF